MTHSFQPVIMNICMFMARVSAEILAVSNTFILYFVELYYFVHFLTCQLFCVMQ